MIKLSIIIPAYNVESRIEKCLKNILYTDFTDLEVIIVDDGSTDNTAEIIEKFQKKDRRVKALHQTNKGVSSARNLGLKVALGEWIMFVDADDYLEKNYLDRLLPYIKHTAKADLIMFKFKIVGEYTDNGRVKSKDAYITNIKNLVVQDQWKSHLPIYGPFGKLFKRSILSKYDLKFDEELSIGEDTVFSYKYYLKINRVILLPDELYNYFRTQNSLSTIGIADIRQLVNARIKILDLQRKFEKKYPQLKKQNYFMIGVVDSTKIILLNASKSGQTKGIIYKQFCKFLRYVSDHKIYILHNSVSSFLISEILVHKRKRMFILMYYILKILK